MHSGVGKENAPITTRQWKIIASRYNNSLLTPRDYHLHFKHITHRRIGTNNNLNLKKKALDRYQ
eukprot:scaffold9830_cov129-Isochrysis_galbana.AAC.1